MMGDVFLLMGSLLLIGFGVLLIDVKNISSSVTKKDEKEGKNT